MSIGRVNGMHDWISVRCGRELKRGEIEEKGFEIEGRWFEIIIIGERT